MKRDFWRVIGILSGCLLIGLVTGQILLCLLIGSLFFNYWFIKSVNDLRLWIHHRYDSKTPEMPGVIDEIGREVDFIRLHYRQREEKLTGYLRRFQKATEALPDAVIVLGEGMRIEWANTKAREYLGIDLPRDNANRIVNLVRHPDLIQFINEGAADNGIKNLEIQLADNPEMRLEFRLAKYGETQALLVARDITQIHRINQMRTDFIANASHELRTPLTVISGYLESLEDDIDDGMESWVRQIEQMRNQTTRMRTLIEDLLKLASLESADDLEHVEVVQVPNMLNGIQDEAKKITDTSHLFSIEMDQGLWIQGDRKQLYSAFSNLVFNAVQHTPDKGVISIHWFEDDRGAVFEINDTGEGIESEHISRLTERFYRVDKGRSRDKGGTGLGLAIVKHILARHHARLQIESVLGEGSTFRCIFDKDQIVQRDHELSSTANVS